MDIEFSTISDEADDRPAWEAPILQVLDLADAKTEAKRSALDGDHTACS